MAEKAKAAIDLKSRKKQVDAGSHRRNKVVHPQAQ